MIVNRRTTFQLFIFSVCICKMFLSFALEWYAVVPSQMIARINRLLVFRIYHRTVDLVFGYAHVIAAFVPVCFQLLRNVFSDTALRTFEFVRTDRERRLPFLRNSRNAFNPATPLLFVFARLIIAEVIDENTTISSRARDTATFSRRQPPVWLSGPKLRATPAAAVRPVTYGEQNNVALVALYVFQVLNKERLFALVGRVFQFVAHQRVRQPPLDIILLRRAERHDADTRTAQFRIFQPAHHFFHQRFRFRFVPLGKPSVVDPVGHQREPYLAFQRVREGNVQSFPP